MNKILLSIACILTSFFPLMARADAMPDGNHNVENKAMLYNASEYPDYNFYVVTERYGATPIASTPVEIHPKESDRARLIAVKKSDEPRIVHGEFSYDDDWFKLAANKKLIVTANMPLPAVGYVPDSNPTTESFESIRIVKMTPEGMEIVVTVTNGQYIELNRAVVTATSVTAKDLNEPLVSHYGEVACPDINPEIKTVVTLPQPINNMLVGTLIVCLGVIGLLIVKLSWKK